MAIIRPVTTNNVNPNPLPGQRLQAADFDVGQTLGRAATVLGQTGMQVAKDVREIEVEDARTRARDAFNRAQIAEQEYLYGENGFYNQRGVAAVNSAAEARAQLDRIYRENGADLRDGMAQEMYGDVVSRRRAAELEKFNRHLSTERARYQEGVDREARTVELNGAVAGRDDPLEIERRLSTVADITAQQAVRMGLGTIDAEGNPDTTIQSIVQQEQGKVVAAVAAAYANESPERALDFVRDMVGRGRIDQVAATRLIDELNEPAAAENADIEVAEFAVYSNEETPVEQPSDDPNAPRVAVPMIGGSYDPTHGVNRGVTTTPDQHQARGGGTGRNAIDIAAAAGTPLFPPVGGTVSEIGFEADGAGHYVRVRHANGYETTYMHLASRPNLQQGQAVTPNTEIGAVGSTGSSTGNHVDFSVRRIGQTALVDPRSVNWTGGTTRARLEPGRELNLQATLERIDASDRTFAEKQALKEAARRQQGLVVARREQTERQVRDDVDRFLDTLPANGLTSVDQIPVELRTRLAEVPGLRTRLVNEAATNVRQAEAEAAGEQGGGKSQEYEDLFRLANGTEADRQAFARMNIDEIDNLSSADRRSFIRTQGTILRSEGGDRQRLGQVNYNSIYTLVGRVAPPEAGVAGNRSRNRATEQARNRQALTRLAVNEIARQQVAQNRELTLDEKTAIIQSFAQPVQVVTRGGIGGQSTREVPLYRAPEVARAEGGRYVGTRIPGIPSDQVSQITESYERLFGRRPNTAEIIRIYGDMQR